MTRLLLWQGGLTTCAQRAHAGGFRHGRLCWRRHMRARRAIHRGTIVWLSTSVSTCSCQLHCRIPYSVRSGHQSTGTYFRAFQALNSLWLGLIAGHSATQLLPSSTKQKRSLLLTITHHCRHHLLICKQLVYVKQLKSSLKITRSAWIDVWSNSSSCHNLRAAAECGRCMNGNNWTWWRRKTRKNEKVPPALPVVLGTFTVKTKPQIRSPLHPRKHEAAACQIGLAWIGWVGLVWIGLDWIALNCSELH